MILITLMPKGAVFLFLFSPVLAVHRDTACMVHRLCTVFTFARPAVIQDLGQDMAHWQQQVLKRLAAPDSDDTLVSQLLAADS